MGVPLAIDSLLWNKDLCLCLCVGKL